jgi:hypothetical protein
VEQHRHPQGRGGLIEGKERLVVIGSGRRPDAEPLEAVALKPLNRRRAVLPKADTGKRDEQLRIRLGLSAHLGVGRQRVLRLPSRDAEAAQTEVPGGLRERLPVARFVIVVNVQVNQHALSPPPASSSKARGQPPTLM